MIATDLINAALELGGAFFVALNALDIQRKKAVAGATLPTIGFFTAWGLWNVLFYPSLGLWFSAGAGVVVLLVNLWFATLIWRYRDGWEPEAAEVEYDAAV